MKRQQDEYVDEPFDVEPVMPVASSAPPAAPKDLLSASKVEAVRFHPAKPGYAFDQVETFVDAVTRTLRYLEQRMYQDDVAIHEADEENDLLNEQIATLKATIEVFRANGDPVGTSDGGFATASTVEDPALRAERDSLAAALLASQAEVADLRLYIEQQLAPWIEEQGQNDIASVDPINEAEESLEVTNPPIEDPALDEKSIFEATAAAFSAQSDEETVVPEFVSESNEVSAEESSNFVSAPESEVIDEPTEIHSAPHFSTPEIEALGVEIDPAKIIQTDDSQYERATPPKAGSPLPRLLPPEIAAMMDLEEEN